MQTILTVFQVFLSLGLIGLILIQHGKGADAGAAFGSGASATVFGARGSGSFLTRTTAIMAALFFLTSMALAYYATQGAEPVTVMDRVDERTIVVPPPEVDSPASDIPAIPGSAPGSRDLPTVEIPATEAPAASKVTSEVTDAPVETIESAVIEGSSESMPGDAVTSPVPDQGDLSDAVANPVVE